MYFEYICWKFAGRLLDSVNTPLETLHPIVGDGLRSPLSVVFCVLITARPSQNFLVRVVCQFYRLRWARDITFVCHRSASIAIRFEVNGWLIMTPNDIRSDRVRQGVPDNGMLNLHWSDDAPQSPSDRQRHDKHIFSTSGVVGQAVGTRNQKVAIFRQTHYISDKIPTNGCKFTTEKNNGA